MTCLMRRFLPADIVAALNVQRATGSAWNIDEHETATITANDERILIETIASTAVQLGGDCAPRSSAPIRCAKRVCQDSFLRRPSITKLQFDTAAPRLIGTTCNRNAPRATRANQQWKAAAGMTGRGDLKGSAFKWIGGASALCALPQLDLGGVQELNYATKL